MWIFSLLAFTSSASLFSLDCPEGRAAVGSLSANILLKRRSLVVWHFTLTFAVTNAIIQIFMGFPALI